MPEIVLSPNRVDRGDGGSRCEDIVSHCKAGYVDSWTCKKTTKVGDLYLFYFCNPVFAVTAVGVSDGNVIEEKNDGTWDWTSSRRGWFCRFAPLIRLGVPITADDIRASKTLSTWWKGIPFQGRPKAIQAKYATVLLELIRSKNSHKPRLCRLLSEYVSGEDIVPTLRQSTPSSPRDCDPRFAVDVDKPPSRNLVTVNRVIRDTQRTRSLKDLYDSQCQCCRTRLLLPRGLAYCEAHHLRPLGGDHKGKDCYGNMVVVCPRCHAELDLMALAIDPTTLRIATCWAKHPLKGKRLHLNADHEINRSNLRYHWRLYKAENRTDKKAHD